MMTRMAGFSARISRVASIPEPSGRRISKITRAGRYVLAASIACAAVPAWATTEKAARRSSSATSPSRTTSWSSTTRIRRTEGSFVSTKGGTCRDGSSGHGADRGPTPCYALRVGCPVWSRSSSEACAVSDHGPRIATRRHACPRSTSSYLSSSGTKSICALHEEPEYRPDQLALEGPDRLLPGLVVGLHAARDIRLGGWVEARLGERDDVERPVELAVAAPVEAYPLHLSRAGRDRRHTREGGQGIGGAEAADVANLGDEPSHRDRSRPRQPEERMPFDERTDPARRGLDLPLEARQAVQECTGELRLKGVVPP